MSAVVPDEAPNSVCTQCGAKFRCGMAGGDGQCWCAGLPPFMPVPGEEAPGAACLCLECLLARLAVKSSA